MSKTTDTTNSTNSSAAPAIAEDRVVWRRELQQAVKVSSETIRRWMLDGRLPEPDVNLSNRTKGWRVSTLRAAGINLA
jgi:predicted DNA-binding transcriptional regulator AlpA